MYIYVCIINDVNKQFHFSELISYLYDKYVENKMHSNIYLFLKYIVI